MAYSVTSAFRTAVAAGHRAIVRADVCQVDGTIVTTLQPLDGTVTIDFERSVRREAGDVTLVDPSGALVVDDAADILSPLTGYELRLYRGVRYGDGSEEVVPLGVFGWTRTSVAESDGGLTITLGGLQDRAARISRTRLSQPYAVSTATAVEDVIEALLTRAWPDVDLGGGLPTTGRTTPAAAWQVEGDADPWEDCYAIADQCGYRLAVDVDGQVVMQSIGGGATDPVAGYGDGTLLSVTRDWDITDTYNGVIAIGVGSGLLIPARAVAWDDDPASATYYEGSFGRRPRVYVSGLLLTAADARAAADAQLAKTLGITEAVSFTALVDPSLDVGDRITVTRDALGISGTYRIDRLEIPLAPDGVMAVGARSRRVTS